MLSLRASGLILSLGALLWTATPSRADLPKGEVQPEAPSLAGQLLVASPDMQDPRFRQAVILIVEHDDHGALGIVVNRPIGEAPVADLLKDIGRESAGVTGSVRIFAGGPVEPRAGFVIHSAEYNHHGTLAIDDRVAMTASPDILSDIGRGQGPAKSLVAFGYAGWGAGQLERELARGAWFTEPEDPALVFDAPRDQVWDGAMARRPGRP
jgi:putative transcriptional regulator